MLEKKENLELQRTFWDLEEFLPEKDIYPQEWFAWYQPQGDTVFGFWMQTLADLDLLNLELQGLTKQYTIDPFRKTVHFQGDTELLRRRIAHLERVGGKPTLYTCWVELFGDTNAYAFHNLYPYKGKFYPRVVRTLINAFRLNEDSLLLDPFNGSGTTTHEAALMGIKSVGLDITPVGVLLAQLKNDLIFVEERKLDLSPQDLKEIYHLIKDKKWNPDDPFLRDLMLTLYFDTFDAFERTSRYQRKGEIGLFVEKFRYLQNCYFKTMEIKKQWHLSFTPAKIYLGDALELSQREEWKGHFDACITSPPYFFSIDYVGKDKVAYDYWGIDPRQIESRYLGMKNHFSGEKRFALFPPKVARYYEDLKQSIQNIYWALKPGGKLAIVVGDSIVNNRKIPTTYMTKIFCEEAGFHFEKLIFNPLLGARNRAIRGESIILCTK